MEVVQKESVKIVTSLLVNGPVSTLEDEGVLDLLKRHGSIARVIPVNNLESKYHDHTIVEYNSGSAIESISPFLPLSYTSKENPSLSYQIRALSSVYSWEESSDATTSYLSTLKNIAKLTGKSFNALLREELSQISSSLTPDEVDEDEAALVELSSTKEQNASKTNAQSPGSVRNEPALNHDDLPRVSDLFSTLEDAELDALVEDVLKRHPLKRVQRRRLLKKGAVPTLFEWNNYSASAPRRTRAWLRREVSPPLNEDPVPVDLQHEEHDYCSFPVPAAVDLSLDQTEDLRKEVEQLRKQVEELSVRHRFCLGRFAASDDDIRFYTRFVTHNMVRVTRARAATTRSEGGASGNASNHIPAPTGATHEELFTLLCENIDISAADFAPPPPFSSKKHVQKRKNIDPASTPAAAAPKQAGGPAGSARAGNSTVQSNNPVLSELSSIQSSLFNMNSRIQTLEFAQHPSPLQISFSPACLPPTPQMTMGSPLALHSFHRLLQFLIS
ncbi:hypothetical protein G5714_002555 [Onychostoma macrolepis]|uniref:Uncharacterized protein n=1 Tax=Onychostoma macrolepis TaxID=369639 RepID=A0A7J6D728_9TELE|nr:hypothetical protein G5714_002555 [Onychostoma macrolepis]